MAFQISLTQRFQFPYSCKSREYPVELCSYFWMPLICEVMTRSPEMFVYPVVDSLFVQTLKRAEDTKLHALALCFISSIGSLHLLYDGKLHTFEPHLRIKLG